MDYISPQAQPETQSVNRRTSGNKLILLPPKLSVKQHSTLHRTWRSKSGAYPSPNHRQFASLRRHASTHKAPRSPRIHAIHITSAAMLGLSAMQPRQLAAQVLNFALVLSTAFMLWKGISVVSDSPSPIVVVLSGSMEPAFQRGDLLFLWNRGLDTQIGEIVVYNVKGKDIPIVHRVVRRYGGG